MGTVSQKLEYLNETKGILKEVINYSGAGITSETTFRNYAAKLYDGYVDILKNKYVLLDNMPKGQVEGISAVINNAEDLPIYNFKFTKESTQDGNPTPDNPVPVNVVEGYRNLFDKDNANIANNIVVSYTGPKYNTSSSGAKTLYINIKPNTTYTISKIKSELFRVGTSVNIPANNVTITNLQRNDTGTVITLTSGASDNYLGVSYFNNNDTLTEQEILDSIMIVEGNQELPYVFYGNNYVAVNVSDGTNTNKYPIPLNNNIIAGIGEYLDEYIVDKNGHCWLNKLTEKVVFDGSESWNKYGGSKRYYIQLTNSLKPTNNNQIGKILSNNFKPYSADYTSKNIDIDGISLSTTGEINIRYVAYNDETLANFKTWLSTHNTEVYYALAESQLIDLNATVDLKLFKGVNNITNSEDGNMRIRYVKDISDLL